MNINKGDLSALKYDIKEILGAWIGQYERWIGDTSTSRKESIEDYHWLETKVATYTANIERILGKVENMPKVWNPYKDD